MEKSQIHFYSIGIVAEDREPNSERIKVIPIEVNFVEPTDVKEKVDEVENNFVSEGATDSLKIKKSNVITPKWWRFNSNRVNPPDVKKEDYVLVLRVGETDMYFWIDLNMSNVKRLEDAIYAWAASPDNQMASDLSNAYVLNISPRDGHFTLRTSRANGEKAGYLFQWNTKEGTWQNVDDKGNKYYMNSVEDDLGFENAMLSKVNINKEEAFIFAKTRIKFEGKTIEEKCEERICNASNSVLFKTKLLTSDADNTKTTGDLAVAKNFSYDGVGSGKGMFTVSDAKIAGVTFSIHVHTEQGDGNDTSRPH